MRGLVSLLIETQLKKLELKVCVFIYFFSFFVE